MDYKVFFSTFILIFLAELGDKTQLTALAFSSNSKSVWPVFFGASFALVCSTMLACLCGSILKNQSLVSMSWIKGVSGSLFIIFGLVIIINLFRSADEGERYESILEGVSANMISRVVLNAAGNLEEDAIKHYEEAVALIENENVRGQLKNILAEEKKHFADFFNHDLYAESNEDIAYPKLSLCKNHSCRAVQIIEGMLIHEKDAALFYRALASKINFKSVSLLLLKVAREEEEHAIILEKILAENKNLQ